MKLIALGLLIGSTLCGCAIFEEQNTATVNNDDLERSYSENTYSPLESSVTFQQQFHNKLANHNGEIRSSYSNNEHNEDGKQISSSKLNVNHYAKGLMQDLVENLQHVDSTTPVAVVSFVMLDGDYNQSSLLGNQMAESLIHEIHQFGIPVIDYKTTGFIRITEHGDFAFSKDYEELGQSLVAQYIFGGTMTKHKEGYLVNARVIGLESKTVVASAQNFIPNEIAEALMDKNRDATMFSNQSQNIKSEKPASALKEVKNTAQTISLIPK
jgi:TolB-like protein